MQHPTIPTLALIALIALPCAGQVLPKRARGGSMELDGVRIHISEDEINRHLEIITRLNPESPYRRRLALAWARAVRVEGAKHEKLELDAEGYGRWMEKQHAAVRQQWMMNDAVNPGLLMEYIRSRGFDSLEAYEAFCREEYMSEKYLGLEFPTNEPTEAEVKERFETLNTRLVITALTWAPETLDVEPLDRENPECLAEYERWWAAVPEARKRQFDDEERPALEAEAIYVRFSDKGTAELRELFETKRNGLGGRSLEDVTRDLEPDAVVRNKLWSRWSQFRKRHYLKIDADIPPGTDDWSAFELAEAHLVREWKIVRYMGQLWKKLRASKPGLDLKAFAVEHGVSYAHRPFRAVRDLVNDEELPGDHPFTLRKTTPGTIYDYHTDPSHSSIWITEGVTDQPGLHASIWRLVRAEEQRVRTAREVIDRAWPEFERAWRWVIVRRHRRQWEETLSAMMKAYAKEQGKPLAEVVGAARAKAFAHVLREAKNAKRLGPFFLKPYIENKATVRKRGSLGKRVRNMIQMEWARIARTPRRHEPGEILPLLESVPRATSALLRVERVLPPKPGLWKMDSRARERARLDLARERHKARIGAIRRNYAWPNIMKVFKLEAPELNEVMLKDIGKPIPVEDARKK